MLNVDVTEKNNKEKRDYSRSLLNVFNKSSIVDIIAVNTRDDRRYPRSRNGS